MTSSNTDIPLGVIRSAGKGKDDFANRASGELETIVVEGMTKVYLVNGETNSSQTDLETLEGAFDVVVKGTDATTQTASPITAGWMQVAVRELSGHLDSAKKGAVRLLQSALKYGRIVSAFFLFLLRKTGMFEHLKSSMNKEIRPLSWRRIMPPKCLPNKMIGGLRRTTSTNG